MSRPLQSHRWEQVTQLFDAALKVSREDRASFLTRSCGADADLRGEVDSLLAFDQPDSRAFEDVIQRAIADILGS